MIPFLYSCALFLYKLTMQGLAWFHPKAKAWAEGQKEAWNQLQAFANHNHESVIWFHVASLGEYEQARPLMLAIREKEPLAKVLVTFFSPSGYRVRAKDPCHHGAAYLPLDSAQNAQKFMALIRPKQAYFIKYEFWHFYLQALKSHGIPCYLVAANFRADQLFFKSYGGFFRNMLSCFQAIFVQTSASKECLDRIGIDSVYVAGDTRYDRVYAQKKGAEEWELLEWFRSGQELVLLGSVWEADMEVLIPLIKRLGTRYKWAIAPHEIDSENLNDWARSLDLPHAYSKGSSTEALEHAQVLFINEIGKLALCYRRAQWAYIGGAFGSGLHNILEALVYGIPVLFGNKKHHKFPEAMQAIEWGIGFAVKDAAEVQDLVLSLDDPQVLEEKRNLAERFFEQHLGATERILSTINCLPHA